MEKLAAIIKKHKKTLMIFSPFTVVAAAALLLYAAGEMYLHVPGSASGEDVVSIGGRDLLNMSNLTPPERELYQTLSKNGGIITDKLICTMGDNRHWDEFILKKDESVGSVAKKHHITAEALLRINGIDGKIEREKDIVIYVPRGREHIEETSVFVEEVKKREAEFLRQKKLVSVTAYIVKEGDTLWSVAERFGLGADTIIGSNSPEKTNTLLPGTVLRIPDREGIFVKIPEDESVERLSSLYGTKIDQVCAANGIGPGSPLSSGRELFLPGANYAAVIQTESGMVKIASGREHLLRNALVWPVRGRVSSLFGWRSLSYASAGSFHSGLDIVAPYGRAIVSAMDGVVVYSGWMGGYGKTVVIDHAYGITTLYGHCSELAVQKGDPVYSGQIISYVGSTGRSTGSHLHFEVRKNNLPVDPLSALR
ncbi:MAG: peptidoglycan DD-metalloendopeptidase family protein [Synergistaceae bacterium]|nr:peptidoglycan DD-metalloendopeptidase family protein [Synergistaceae bacterium]